MIQNIISWFSGYFSVFSLFDLLDISIVTYIIYKLFKFVRETRAEQLVKGIVILIVALQFSEWLKLETINFILKNTMQLGLVAVLVVFQPELRRALEKMGRSNVGKMFNPDQGSNDLIIEEIISAVSTLSFSKIGSLIVIERDTKIGEITKTGTLLDAALSAQLLVNIFIPNTPLHDGAVIIRENKIQAAGCFLPLTQNANLSKELGTRHRAAIGITEISDAIVVVTSEETGKISYALDGSLTRNLSADTLKKAIRKALENENSGKNNKLMFWKGGAK